jgi:Neprosin
MTRLTLEMLTKFRTLDDFFAKEPGVVRRKDVSTQQTWDGTHLHAYAYQSVNNFGGNSWLDLWNPQGDFSISQQWYVGGQGCNTQTVEGGWQVYPLKYGTNDAVLFIYWTNNDYNAAGCTPIANAGCYNLDCVGFHQTNNDWHLGAIWGEYSTLGGTQVGFEMQWKLYQGNWWLWLNSEPVGYYPTSIYNGGQLSEQATVIEYGGEVARLVGDVWPQMGSGQFAERGFEFASYQNTIFWITPEETGVWAELTKADEALPVCYTIELTDYPNGGSWGTYFFFGGSGAITCN